MRSVCRYYNKFGKVKISNLKSLSSNTTKELVSALTFTTDYEEKIRVLGKYFNASGKILSLILTEKDFFLDRISIDNVKLLAQKFDLDKMTVSQFQDILLYPVDALDYYIEKYDIKSLEQLSNIIELLKYNLLGLDRKIIDKILQKRDFSEKITSSEAAHILSKQYSIDIGFFINKLSNCSQDFLIDLYETEKRSIKEKVGIALIDYDLGESLGLTIPEINIFSYFKGSQQSFYSYVNYYYSAVLEFAILSKALEKIPKYTGVVYRGLRVNLGEIEDQIKGGVFVDKGGFTGTTKLLDKARQFSGKDGLLMKIKSFNGHYIESLFNHDEEEVLFNVGTKFKVLSFDKNKKVLILEEIK